MKKVFMLFLFFVLVFACDCSPAVIKDFGAAQKSMVGKYKILDKSVTDLNKNLEQEVLKEQKEIVALNNVFIQTQKRTVNIYKLAFYVNKQVQFPFNDVFVKIKNLNLKMDYSDEKRK